METKAKRTLVKSAPELWELADDLSRMETWMAQLVGEELPPAVEVTEREPARALSWRTSDGEARARIGLQLAERGFGTSVTITAHLRGTERDAGAVLERLLDELGSPERQPFVG